MRRCLLDILLWMKPLEVGRGSSRCWIRDSLLVVLVGTRPRICRFSANNSATESFSLTSHRVYILQRQKKKQGYIERFNGR